MRMISIAIVLGLLAFDDRLLLAIGLNGCELRLVTDSPSGLRAMRARLGLRLALGRCRASNSIRRSQQDGKVQRPD